MRAQSRYAALRHPRDDGALHSLFASPPPAQRGARAQRRRALFGLRNMLIAAVCVTSVLFWLAVHYYVRPGEHWKSRVLGEDPYDSFYGDARALSDEELQALAHDLQEGKEETYFSAGGSDNAAGAGGGAARATGEGGGGAADSSGGGSSNNSSSSSSGDGGGGGGGGGVGDELQQSSQQMTKVWAALWARGVGRNRFKGTGGGDGDEGERHKRAAGAPPPLPQLDSCRRCAAFSATDFLPGAADAALAAQDPYAAVLQAEAEAAAEAASRAGSGGSSNSSGSGGGGGRSGVGGGVGWGGSGGLDVRRRQCRRDAPYIGGEVRGPYVQWYHNRIIKYIQSPEYRARAARIAAHGGRGLLIPAGGPRYTTNLLISLHVIRRHFNCSLPIEVAWQGDAEMDWATWAAIQRNFAPIRGFNVKSQPHPVPNLHGKTFDATSYSGKVFALALSEFKEVLLLDADSLPLVDPAQLFDDPRFRAHGSLFWPDAWTGEASRVVMGGYGIDAEKAERVLAMGRGTGRRDAESGQLLLDRSRHLDVIEALLFINRHPDSNAGLLWGDKDTYWLAMAAVGKAHCYNQVAVPPSGFFHWAEDMLLNKITDKKGPGWQLGGFVQNLEDEPFVYGVNSMAGAPAPPPPAPPPEPPLPPADPSPPQLPWPPPAPPAPSPQWKRKHKKLRPGHLDGGASSSSGAAAGGHRKVGRTVGELVQQMYERDRERHQEQLAAEAAVAAKEARDAAAAAAAAAKQGAQRRLAAAEEGEAEVEEAGAGAGVGAGAGAAARRRNLLQAAQGGDQEDREEEDQGTGDYKAEAARLGVERDDATGDASAAGAGAAAAAAHASPPLVPSTPPPPAPSPPPPAPPDATRNESVLAAARDAAAADVADEDAAESDAAAAADEQAAAEAGAAAEVDGALTAAVAAAALNTTEAHRDEGRWRQLVGAVANATSGLEAGLLAGRAGEALNGSSSDSSSSSSSSSGGGLGATSVPTPGPASANSTAATSPPPLPPPPAPSVSPSQPAPAPEPQPAPQPAPEPHPPSPRLQPQPPSLPAPPSLTSRPPPDAPAWPPVALRAHYGGWRGRAKRPGESLLAPLGPGLTRPVFLHRTINKVSLGALPWLPELLSAPITQRWARYYLALESEGPTRGVPWDYTVPAHAITILEAAAPEPTAAAAAAAKAVAAAAAARGHGGVEGVDGGEGGGGGEADPELSGLRWLPTGQRGSAPAHGASLAAWLVAEWRSIGGRRGGGSSSGGGEDAARLAEWETWALGGRGEDEGGGGSGLWGWWLSGGGRKGAGAGGARRKAVSGGRRGSDAAVAVDPAAAANSSSDSSPAGPQMCLLVGSSSSGSSSDGLAAAAAATQAGSGGGCPWGRADVEAYLRAIDAGLPLDRHPAAEAACRPQLLAAAAAAANATAAAAARAEAILVAVDKQKWLQRRERLRNAGGHSDDEKGKDDDFDWLPWFFRGAVDSYRNARYDGILDVLPLPRTTTAPYAYLETATGEGGGLSPPSPENLAARRPEAEAAAGGGTDASSSGGGAAAGAAAAGAAAPPLTSYLYYMWDGDGLDAPPPLPALRQDWSSPWPCADSPTAAVLRASYAAYAWVRRHRRQFPLLERVPHRTMRRRR
ncbi:hypothetical protein HXX76_001003 [Chlamydomonas incerta]|uniref:Uncharacterized protein n=1 Tax=Chlamydomonas incerta TaxID=51695 RepID=A0A836B0Q4_CHLIN|nr:hypothetical protein HXX76_001003 [Chlamydomonas incerta]|eukprot:KAG2444246.1 hypothetical protein HXX76_001003 [Chlamydomonas incerta]